ncbi:MAG: xanthine dehydrogenase family protein molybdopterin-binding subunit [Rhodospirillaceae bacterium]|nr:xanthine dehydrogenase family protein molybdopterin-binding subunit [Rhodospirillaceae bacterium]
MAQFGFGQAMRRSEDPRLLTGRGRYTDDVMADGQAYLVLVRSPFAHAEITGLDVSAAREAAGVLDVITGADLEAAGIGTVECKTPVPNRDGTPFFSPVRPTLATTRVRHVGDPVAAVVATSPDLARDAAELVEVDYEPLDAATGTKDTTEPGRPQVWDEAPNNIAFDWDLGDRIATDAVFAEAARVISIDLVNNRIVPNPMEERACAADFDPASGVLSVYVSSQGVHSIRDSLADDIFHLPKDKVVVRTTDVGGGFGMKLFMYPEYVATGFAAMRLGRPVKWTSERTEAFLSDDHGRDNVVQADLALDADARFLALRVKTYAAMGAYLSNYAPFVATMAGNRMLAGLYRFRHVYVNVLGTYTHTTPVDAYRGAGRPEAAYLVERLVDKAARELGLSPVEIRRRNFIPPEAMPYTTATGLVYDSGEFQRNVDDAVKLADWDGFAARRAAAADRGKLAGIGLATYVEACGGGGPEWATVRVARSGDITVTIGTQSNGQGHETAYKQLVAEQLGVAPDRITVVQGDTTIIARGSGTGGSRSIPVGGASVNVAALAVQDRAKALAADYMEAAVADIHYEEGRFSIVGTDRSMTLADIAQRSPTEVAMEEQGSFKPPAATFPNGAHVVEVEVDPETGGVEIVRYTVVDDFGRVLNPLMLAGQVHGGVAQGVGQALLEHTVFDSEGQLLTGSLMDYALPRADVLPFLTFQYNEVPCTTNPLGVKGAGEAGAIGAPPAIINAVVDALAPLGIEHVDMPATPDAVWALIQAARPAPLSSNGLAAQ